MSYTVNISIGNTRPCTTCAWFDELHTTKSSIRKFDVWTLFKYKYQDNELTKGFIYQLPKNVTSLQSRDFMIVSTNVPLLVHTIFFENRRTSVVSKHYTSMLLLYTGTGIKFYSCTRYELLYSYNSSSSSDIGSKEE